MGKSPASLLVYFLTMSWPFFPLCPSIYILKLKSPVGVFIGRHWNYRSVWEDLALVIHWSGGNEREVWLWTGGSVLYLALKANHVIIFFQVNMSFNCFLISSPYSGYLVIFLFWVEYFCWLAYVPRCLHSCSQIFILLSHIESVRRVF